MAAWMKMPKLHPMVKRVVITACGAAALSGAAYMVYKYFSLKSLFSLRDDSSDEGFEDLPVNEGEKRVLVLGLDGAGKSSILAALGKQKQPLHVSPTEGFHVIYVQTKGMSLNIWEIGGAKHMRDYWRNFIQDTRILVFVVDSSDPGRFDEAREELKKLLQEKSLGGVGVILVANKQDLPGAKSSEEVQTALDMVEACTMETQVPPSGKYKGVQELQNLLTTIPS